VCKKKGEGVVKRRRRERERERERESSREKEKERQRQTERERLSVFIEAFGDKPEENVIKRKNTSDVFIQVDSRTKETQLADRTLQTKSFVKRPFFDEKKLHFVLSFSPPCGNLGNSSTCPPLFGSVAAQ